jgi:membrane protease YdiL (CAAX protease family)
MQARVEHDHNKILAPPLQESSEIPQYKPSKVLLVWTAAAVPMAILGWVVAPAFARDSSAPGFERIVIMCAGLIWQCALVVLLLYRETGRLRWSIIRQRLWLNSPRSPQTGELRPQLWWWLVPLALITALFQLQVSGILNKVWTSLFPFLAEPSGLSFSSFLSHPETKAQMVGNWQVLALFVISALFNTVLGEELLFRGLLLPRMKGAFGKSDWMMNGLLFGLYHLHQPWGMLSSIIGGAFFYALPSRYFRSAWFGIIAHSGQSLFITVLLLGMVLGLA